MPGRYEMIESWMQALKDYQVQKVICLTSFGELSEKSPEYAEIISNSQNFWKQEIIPIPDFGIPDDRELFLRVAKESASEILSGSRILIHCGAGIGRTGTFAHVILLCLGLNNEDARVRVLDAGSSSEVLSQRELIQWCQKKLLS